MIVFFALLILLQFRLQVVFLATLTADCAYRASAVYFGSFLLFGFDLWMYKTEMATRFDLAVSELARHTCCLCLTCFSHLDHWIRSYRASSE